MEPAMKLSREMLKQIEGHIRENMATWVMDITSRSEAGQEEKVTQRIITHSDPQLLERVSRLEDGLARTREQLLERIVRVEEGLEHLAATVREGFAAIDQRFAQHDKRFDHQESHFNQRFDQQESHFNQRFDHQDKRLDRLFRVTVGMMSIGFTVMTLLIAYGTFMR